MKTVIYARKSRGTIEELNSQIEICEEYCSKNSYEIAEIFSEIRSSQDFEREQYKALKEYIKKYTHVRVIVTHLDRLNRNLIEQAKLNDLLLSTASYIEVVGSGVIQLDTPEQQMLSNIINSFNEYNYKLIRYKMMTGLHSFQERGGKVGRTPIGYVRVDKYHYVLDLEKADIIKNIFTDIASGVSTKEVANRLEQINFRSNNNKRIGTREIRNIVKNKVYYKNIPQIVTREQYLEANSQLRSLVNCGNKRVYPLSGKIICNKCRTSLIIGIKKDRNAIIINSCNSSNIVRGIKTKCSCQGVRYDTIEAIVKSDCKAYIENKLSELYQKLTDDKAVLAEHQKELNAVNAEISDNKEKLTRLNRLFLLGNVTEQELQEHSREYKDSITLLCEKQRRLESYSLFKVTQELQDRIIRLEEMQSSADMKELAQLVDHVEYFKDSAGITVNTIFKG